MLLKENREEGADTVTDTTMDTAKHGAGGIQGGDANAGALARNLPGAYTRPSKGSTSTGSPTFTSCRS